MNLYHPQCIAAQPPAWSIKADRRRWRIPDVPCSRYDTGERDPRVIETLQYTLGMIAGVCGGTSRFMHNEIWRSIARLHDHKGWLFVVAREPIDDFVRQALGTAWELAAGEDMPVQFTNQDSPEWATIRRQFQFETDWVSRGDDYYRMLEKAACGRQCRTRRYTLISNNRPALINGTFDELLWEQAKTPEVVYEIIDQPDLVSDYIDAYGIDADWITPLRAAMELKAIPFASDWREDYRDLFAS